MSGGYYFSLSHFLNYVNKKNLLQSQFQFQPALQFQPAASLFSIRKKHHQKYLQFSQFTSSSIHNHHLLFHKKQLVIKLWLYYGNLNSSFTLYTILLYDWTQLSIGYSKFKHRNANKNSIDSITMEFFINFSTTTV